SIRGDRVVVGPDHRHGADGHRFLSDVQMEKAADLAERIHLGRLFLEAPDQRHLGQQTPGELGAEPARRRRGLGLSHGNPSSYQRITFSSSTDSRRRTRKIETMMASPTATSAAATHITKNTSACPSAVPCRCPRATSATLAALSMSSIDMKMTSGSRRINTPSTPMLNSTAESATYQEGGTGMLRRLSSQMPPG